MKFSIKKNYLGASKIETYSKANETLSLYEQIGGMHTISLTVDYLINLLCESFDTDVKHVLFDNLDKHNISSFRAKLTTVLVQASGGPKINFTDQFESGVSNGVNEKLLNISNSEFDSLKALCFVALCHYKVKTYLANQLIASIETHRKLLVEK